MFRIKISLDKTIKENHIPINYGPILAQHVVKILNEKDQFYGLYSISSIDFDQVKQIGKELLHDGKAADFILSIYDFNIVEHDLISLFKDRQFFLPNEYKVVYLKIIDPPEFKRMMNYETLSPISVSYLKEEDGSTAYLYPGDILFKDLFFDRLYNLHLLSGGERMDISTCRYFQDSPVIKKKFGFKKGNKQKQLSAFLQDFTIVAPTEIQKIIYYAGVGKLTEEGFGCVGVL